MCVQEMQFECQQQRKSPIGSLVGQEGVCGAADEKAVMAATAAHAQVQHVHGREKKLSAQPTHAHARTPTHTLTHTEWKLHACNK